MVVVLVVVMMMRIIWRVRMLWLWFGLIGRSAQRVLQSYKDDPLDAAGAVPELPEAAVVFG